MDLENGPYYTELHNFEANHFTGECVHCKDRKISNKHPHKFERALGQRTCMCGSPERALLHQMERI